MQLPSARGSEMYHQHRNLAPERHLWCLLFLVELTENTRQQVRTTFIVILNALRIAELRDEHISEFTKRVNIEENEMQKEIK